MSFTRHEVPSPSGDGHAVEFVADFDDQVKVRIEPGRDLIDRMTRVEIPTRSGAFTFYADELSEFIDELIDRWLEVASKDEVAAFGEQSEHRTVQYVYEPDVPDDDRMRNRLVIPMRVGEILDICADDDLDDDDVIEFQVPIG